ncbi:reverse transcriptase domain-containing protein, partial [Acinetobacter baumannii]|uniref:reverse transcriptase domain-containing protein n=1 Tax=Acinetobacter baumannii TaxID=470 RepID=UPI0033987375
MVISFGLSNAPAEFMDLMNRVFQSYLDSFGNIFIEDILVNSKNKGEHMDHLRVVLQVFTKNQLFSKHRKCEFRLRSVEFLGHIIFSEGVEVDPRKTEVVKNLHRQLTPIDIMSFLDLPGYY